MADPDRNTSARLTLFADLVSRPWAFDFYQVLRRIEGLHPDKPRLGEARTPADEPVRLGQDPEFTFAPSNLSRVELRDGIPRISVRFLGLWGPQGAMPMHLTELARERAHSHGDRALVRFADMFHHRLLLTFYRAWRTAQPAASRDHPRGDRFSVQVSSLFGFGSPSMQDRDAIPDDAKRFFAAALSRSTRNAHGLSEVLEGSLAMPVEVDEFSPGWLRLNDGQRTRIGIRGPATRLGEGVVLGGRVRDAQYHVGVRLGPIGLRSYERMLPGGDLLPVARDWTRLHVRDEHFVRARLVLRAPEVPATRLGRAGSLGWTTWLGRWKSEAAAHGAGLPLTSAIA